MNWSSFWFFWLGGLAVFIGLVVTGSALMTDVAPSGILDHQTAGSAANVDAIQASWAEVGRTDTAKWAMVGDLVFIGLYALGGIIGGRLIWQDALSPSLKKLGLLCVIAYFFFGLSDYVETISQITQLLQGQGSDLLASTAATANPVKSITFIIGTLGMIAALIWRAIERRA